jgi:hypothetical protein
MRLDTGLFIELIYIAVISGTLSALITQKVKNTITWLEGFLVILFSLLLNLLMAYLVIKTVVEVDGIYLIGAIVLTTLVGFVDAQVFYGMVKDKWAYFENKPKPEKPTPMTDTGETEDTDGGL